MKMFSKVLALLLALMTVVAMLPMNVLAAAWGKVEAETTETENGTNSDVVVSIDADALAALIEEKGLSADLIYALKDGASIEGLRSLFTMEELFQIIPRNEWLEVFSIDDIINTVGIQKLTSYVEDYATLLRSIAESETAGADLSALMGKVANLEKCVNALLLLEKEYLVPTKENLLAGKTIYDLIKESLTVSDSDLIGLLVIDQPLIDLFIGELNEFVTLEELNKLVKLDKILKDGTLLKPEDVLKDGARETFIATLNDYVADIATSNHDEFKGVMDRYIGNENIATIKEIVISRVKAELEAKLDTVRNDTTITSKNEATEKIDNILASYNDCFTVSYTINVENTTITVTASEPVIIQNDNVLLFQRAWESNWITIDDLCPDEGDDLVNTAGLWNFFLFEKKLVDLDEVADFNTAKNKAIEIAKIPANMQTLLNPANEYVVVAEALKMIGIKAAIDHIEGGYETLLGGTNPMINVSATDGLISKIDLEATLNNIIAAVNAKKITLDSVIKIDVLLNQLEQAGVVGDIADFVSPDAIFDQLDTKELFEILQLLDLKKYLKPALVLAIDNLLANIDKIEIDGTTVAGEDPDTALLKIYPQVLLETITKLLPKLDDILAPEFDGVLLNTNLNLEYTVDGEEGVTPDFGTTKSKKISVKVVITGDLATMQAKLSKLKVKFLDPYFNEFLLDGSNVTLDMNIPGVVAELIRLVVDSDLLDEDLRKMLVQAGEGEDELLAFVNGQLTLDNILAILNAVDADTLYNIMKNTGLVKTILEEVDEKTGSSLADKFSNKTADELIQMVGSSEHSLDDICNIILNKTGKDVKAVLEAMSVQFDDKMDEWQKNAIVAEMLNLVGSKLGINVSTISAADILARAEDTPIVDRVSAEIVERLGADIKAALNTYTAQELYEKALDKVINHEKTIKAINRAKEILNSLSEKDLSLRLADYYQGNGTFHFELSRNYNAKSVVEKFVTKLLSISKVQELGIPDGAIELLLNSISDDGISTANLDLTLTFANLYRIRFFSREDLNNPNAKPLYSAFLPVGASLALFENNKNVTGYAFTGWADKNGNEITNQVMPAGDIDVYADAHAAEIRFETEDGKDLGTILLPPASNINLLNYADADGNVFFDAILNSEIVQAGRKPAGYNPAVNTLSEVYWYVKGDETKTPVNLETKFPDGTVLVCAYKVIYLMNPTDITGKPLEFTVVEENGFYEVILKNWDYQNGFVLDIDQTLLQRAANGTEDVTLSVTDEMGGKFEISLDKATLASLYAQNAKSLKYAYGYANDINGRNSEFAGTMYDQSAFIGNNFCKPEYVSFQILSVDDQEITTFDDNKIAITVPFAHAGGANTNAYAWKDGNRESLEKDLSDTTKITFHTSHFSDFVALNEYAINFEKFVTEDGFLKEGRLAGQQQAGVLYYPVGATITLNFVVTGNYEPILVTNIHTNQEYAIGSVYTVTGDANFSVTLRGDIYYVFYYINGTLWYTQDYVKNSGFSRNNILTIDAVMANSQQTLPSDFFTTYDQSTGKWVGLDALTYINTQDIVLTATWDTIASIYTIKFNVPTGVTAVPDMTVTSSNSVANIVAGLNLPAIPANAKAGAYWDVANYTLDTTGTVITISLKYTEKANAIVNNAGATITDANGNAITSAVAGTTVTVVAPSKEHYNAVVTVVTAQDPNTNLFSNGTFVMPDEIVYVNVTYTPKTYTYTYNGITYEALYGSTVTLNPVTVEKGKVIDTVAISGALSKIELVSVTTNANGAKVFVYAITVLEDNLTVTITTRALTAADILNIFNGKVFEGDSVESGVDNVEFLSWSETVLNAFRFATFGLIDDTASMLWLWILLAILLFALIIALLYRLIIKGKMKKPAFLVRFVVWVVSIFFAVCHFFAAVALKIAGLLGKSDNAEDYGFTVVPEDEEITEEVTEEVAEEVAEEATEEVTEEVAEEVAEEATEEATEEVAEEVTEEATEEATEEVAEEIEAVEETETTEESDKKVILMMPSSQPVEKATEEVTEEATEEVAEETTEEVVTEENTEENN